MLLFMSQLTSNLSLGHSNLHVDFLKEIASTNATSLYILIVNNFQCLFLILRENIKQIFRLLVIYYSNQFRVHDQQVPAFPGIIVKLTSKNMKYRIKMPPDTKNWVLQLCIFLKSNSFFFHQIQMNNFVWVTVIIKVCVIKTFGNLIRNGDFQNLASLGPKRNWFYCQSGCGSSWFASVGGGIELKYIRVPPSKSPTTLADLQNNIPYELCQNISGMEIGKNYRYTFDMICETRHSSCSIWVIFNGQVVNGSNQTSTDYLSHTVTGYINASKQNNTICFYSKQTPFIETLGAQIDNITLYLYTDTVPCYVIGCLSCVLNFPNSCSICQTDHAKEINQTCTPCSDLISNCIKCQKAIKLVCHQCTSQFSPNKEFCYRKEQKYFSSEVQQTKSFDNSFLIKTNLSLTFFAQAGFSIQNLPSINIQINNQRHSNVIFSFVDGFFQAKVILQIQYQHFQIKFEIQQEFIINNNSITLTTSVEGKPSTVFFSEIQILVISKYDELSQPILQNLDKVFVMIKTSGLGFLLSSIFNYINLMAFYAYLNIAQPKSFKLFIQTLVLKLNQLSLYQMINLQAQVYRLVDYQVKEKLQKSQIQWSGPLENGFSTNFYKNSIQSLTIILAVIIRIAIIWILYKIFKLNWLEQSNSSKFISVSAQFHTIIPALILPAFNLIIKQIASRNFIQKINTAIHTSVIFICILIPFVHLIVQFQHIQTKFKKSSKSLLKQVNKHKQIGRIQDLQIQIQPAQTINIQILQKFKQRNQQIIKEYTDKHFQAYFNLFQRLILLSIPIFVIFKQVIPFLIINLFLLFVKLVLSFKIRKYFHICEFFLKAFISLVWILYHCAFCFYFIVQKWLLNQNSAYNIQQISKYLGFLVVIFVIIGALAQLIGCLIGVCLFFKQILTYIWIECKKSNKIDPKFKQQKISNQNQHNRIYANLQVNKRSQQPQIESLSKKKQPENKIDKNNKTQTQLENQQKSNVFTFRQFGIDNQNRKVMKQNISKQKNKIKKTKGLGQLNKLNILFKLNSDF